MLWKHEHFKIVSKCTCWIGGMEEFLSRSTEFLIDSIWVFEVVAEASGRKWTNSLRRSGWSCRSAATCKRQNSSSNVKSATKRGNFETNSYGLLL